jgi:PKD repeat protein
MKYFILTLFLIGAVIADISAQDKNAKEDNDGDEVDLLSTTSCGGVERWSVKVLTDNIANTVVFAPKTTTVAHLVSIITPTPNPYMPRYQPVEDSTYKVTCKITIKKAEADSDFHLVLSNGTQTLIGEIPDPICASVAASPYANLFQACRNFINANIASGNVSNVNIPSVTITGVAFVDPPHGQTGAAPNNLELHPIIDIHFASNSGTPVAAFNVSNTTLCVGQSVTLTGNSINSPTSWHWTTAGGTPSSSTLQNPIINYNSTGTYTITLVTSNSSGNSLPISHTITVVPFPAIPTITPALSTLSSSTSTGNQWYLNGNPIGGATSQSYSVTQNGLYTVCFTDANGCSSCSSPYNFTTTGLIEQNNDMAISVFPNPTEGNIHLNFITLKDEKVFIQLINDLGQTIKSADLGIIPSGNNIKTLAVNGILPGIYSLKISGNGFIRNLQVIIEK